MIVYIYKNNLCDPARKVGTARQFGNIQDVDVFVKMFVASINPEFLSNWRVFITNDNVEFPEVDHYVMMDEPLGLGLNHAHRIKELDMVLLALEFNPVYKAMVDKREKSMERAKKNAERKAPALILVDENGNEVPSV